MSHSVQLKPIGKDPLFPALGERFVSNEGYIMSEQFGGPEVMEFLETIVPREDDVYVASFPKTGTTWLQEIVYLVGTDLNFQKAQEEHLFNRCPFIDWKGCFTNVNELPSPRFMKIHIPYSMFPKHIIEKKSKILYPIRNPKDTLVSFYHFCKGNKYIGYNSDFPTYFDMYLDDKVIYGPYWKHYLEFWNIRHQNNVFITKFEDMKKDLPAVVRDIAKFMNKDLSESQVQAVAKHCGFAEMSKNTQVNPDLHPQAENMFIYDQKKTAVFMRKGEVGDWKNYITGEMNKRMDEHIAQRFKGSGLEFEYLL